MLLDTNDCRRGTVVTIIRSAVSLFWYKCMVLVSVRDYMLNYYQSLLVLCLSLSFWQNIFQNYPNKFLLL